MQDSESKLIQALDLMNEVADELTVERAVDELDGSTLQVFWREWPRTSQWAGAVWRQLNNDIEESAQPAGASEFHETGDPG